jgi:hypothetical protein
MILFFVFFLGTTVVAASSRGTGSGCKVALQLRAPLKQGCVRRRDPFHYLAHLRSVLLAPQMLIFVQGNLLLVLLGDGVALRPRLLPKRSRNRHGLPLRVFGSSFEPGRHLGRRVKRV